MRYKYSFEAYFICDLFNVKLLKEVIPAAVKMFNALPRKKDHDKQISVTINEQKRCLNFELQSDISLQRINFLRASQYFSKALSLQPGMSNYIVGGRILVQ